ncbi:MAG: hypothetical protein ACLP59_09115 [Bryobacteraceae bacterium]
MGTTSDTPTINGTVVFDTSAINALCDTGNQQDFIARMEARCRVLITEANLSEVCATTDPARRGRLLNLCERLLAFGDAVVPHAQIVEDMVRCHRRYGRRFSWRDVEITAPGLADEIRRRSLVGDERIVELVREDERVKKRQFRDMWRDAHDKFEKDFEGQTLLSVTDLIRLAKGEGGTFWALAASHYTRANLFPIDEAALKKFVTDCPPFHAMVVMTYVWQYQYGLPQRNEEARYKAGLRDLCMSVYLPFCDWFVTRDSGQENALRLIACEVGAPVGVVSYERFAKELLE